MVVESGNLVESAQNPERVSAENPLILFDGVCKFCNSSVNFIIARDPVGRFRFAPLQSSLGGQILEDHGLSPDVLDTMVLVCGSRIYTRSGAALQIAKGLHWPWPLLYAFVLIPSFLRELVYKGIARNRYRWFGTFESCRVPTPDIEKRFLA